MKNKLTILILAVLMFTLVRVNLGSAQENKIYDINLSYDKGNISLISEILVRDGYAPGRKIQPDAGYKSEILSLTDNVLYSFKFEIPNKICSDRMDPKTKEVSGGCVLNDKANFALIMPYFENGKVINIYDADGKKVFFASVEHLAKTCGDSICQEYETGQTCPADCSPAAGKEKISMKLIAGAAAVVAVIVVAAIVIAKRKKNNNIAQ